MFNLKSFLFLCFFALNTKANTCLDSFRIENRLTGVLSPNIFKGNDIRGVFLKDFNLDFANTLGKALVSLSKNQFSVFQPKILIGHDARLSSPDLTKALADSLIKQGAFVSIAGLIPSPVSYFLLHHYNYTATVVITASHNPVEYNGFKIMFNKKYDRHNVIKDIKNIIHEKDFLEDSNSGREVQIDPHSPYIESLKKEFSHLKSIPFVVDAGNGAVGPLAKKVFKALGLKPHFLYMEPDGTFPNHHPNPLEESNLADLKKKIAETQSWFGAGFDGDGDRLGIVTSKNKLIPSDELVSMFLPSLLANSKNSKTLVGDVKVSNWFYKKAKQMGAKTVMSPSGYSFLNELMAKHNAFLAMELSGHIMFNDRANRGFDDGLYNLLRFIELIGNKKENIRKLLPQIHTVKTPEIRLSLEPEIIKKSLHNLKNYLDKKKEDYVDVDGIRITRGNSWALFRSSQTESVLSLRFESTNQQEVLSLIQEFSQAMDLKIPEDKIIIYE